MDVENQYATPGLSRRQGLPAGCGMELLDGPADVLCDCCVLTPEESRVCTWLDAKLPGPPLPPQNFENMTAVQHTLWKCLSAFYVLGSGQCGMA